MADQAFPSLIEAVVRQLVTTDHRPGGSFIRTPLLYPSGANAVVRVEPTASTFLVSDMGFGYQEAEMMGAGHVFARHSRAIAENAGVRFDNQAFFVLEASREQLAGAVTTIANCSHEAVALAAYKIAERRLAEDAERLYKRLVAVFKRENVERDAKITGASNTAWQVTAMVKPETGRRVTVFESVTNNRLSVVNAAAKFHDIALTDRPPNRVAVVHNKREFGTYLSLLSQAANVIDEDIDDPVYIKLARAA